MRHKKNFSNHIYLLFGLFCIACQSNPHSENNETINTSIFTIDTPKTNIEKTNPILKFHGTIDNKITIEVKWLLQNSVYVGNLVYTNTKDKKNISLAGNQTTSGEITLYEMMPNGNVTGIWSIIATTTGYRGKWFSPLTRKSYPLVLYSTHDDNSIVINPSTNLSTPTGTYEFHFGNEEGYSGHVIIDSAKSRWTMSINNMTPAPAYNQASLDNEPLTIVQDSAQIVVGDHCIYSLYWASQYLYIKKAVSDCQSEFGYGADIEGLYIKTKD